MFRDELVKEIREKIKELNRERDYATRLKLMIKYQESLRGQFNDLIDDYFSEVNLRVSKVKFDEGDD